MLANPRHGWCRFEIGSFTGSPSYLEDVPVNTLMAFINYYKNGCGSVWYDEEGSSFTLILTPYSVYVIEEKDEPVLHDFSDDTSIDNLAQELIADIESCVDDWAMFTTDYDDVNEIEKHKDKIVEMLDTLREVSKCMG